MESKIKDKENEIIIRNQYILKFNSIPFKLTLVNNTKNNTLSFKLRQVDNIFDYHYVSEFN